VPVQHGLRAPFFGVATFFAITFGMALQKSREPSFLIGPIQFDDRCNLFYVMTQTETATPKSALGLTVSLILKAWHTLNTQKAAIGAEGPSILTVGFRRMNRTCTVFWLIKEFVGNMPALYIWGIHNAEQWKKTLILREDKTGYLS